MVVVVIITSPKVHQYSSLMKGPSYTKGIRTRLLNDRCVPLFGWDHKVVRGLDVVQSFFGGEGTCFQCKPNFCCTFHQVCSQEPSWENSLQSVTNIIHTCHASMLSCRFSSRWRCYGLWFKTAFLSACDTLNQSWEFKDFQKPWPNGFCMHKPELGECTYLERY